MHVTKGVGETLHTCVTKRVAIIWRAPRLPSPPSKSPALDVIDKSGAKRVWLTTSSAHRIRDPFVKAGNVAIRVGPS